MTSCGWTAGGTWPCTSHDGDAHNFDGAPPVPLAVTAVRFPPFLPSGPERSLDVRDMLAARGLLKTEG